MGNRNVEIREMRKGEEILAWKTGRLNFSPVESLAFQKPEQAFLAVSDGQIVGMASYRIFPGKNNQKIGYVETGYVKDGFKGMGIGGELYQKATTHLREQGCETVTSTVKDDNVASWKLFENNGYHVTGFLQMLQSYGLKSSIRLWFKSTLAIATGFHLWSTLPVRKSTSVRQIGIFAFLNFLILLPLFILGRDAESFGLSVAATALLLTASLLGGLFGTLFTQEKWYFCTPEGGLLISVLITVLGGIWPVAGRFYPAEYKRTAAFRRSMGLEGLFEWLAILLLIGAAIALRDQAEIWKNIIYPGTNLLLLHALPVYPFECFGGRRIWEYNKWVSALTIIVSLVLVFFL